MIEKLNLEIEEYFLKNFDIDRLFSSIEKSEFLFLHHIYLGVKDSECAEGMFLSEIADQMKMPVPEASKAIRRLQDKGYVRWDMTQDRKRTYINLTENALNLMQEERQKMKMIYDIIKNDINKEDLEITIATVKKINEIASRMRKDETAKGE